MIIRINKPTGFRIIVSAIEVVEPGFGIVVVSTVAEGVGLTEGVCHVAGHRQQVSPAIIGVVYHHVQVVIEQTQHIALGVVEVVIYRAVVFHRFAGTVAVVVESQDIISGFLGDNVTAVQEIFGGDTADCFRRADAAVVIFEAKRSTVCLGGGRKLTAVCPFKGGSVIIGQRIADTFQFFTIIMLSFTFKVY